MRHLFAFVADCCHRPAICMIACRKQSTSCCCWCTCLICMAELSMIAQRSGLAQACIAFHELGCGNPDCLLQNPTLSACWCVGLCQVMIPVISFSRDTTPFCKSMSIAESALFLVYSIFAFLCNLLGPSFFDLAHVFHFYIFPFSYTSRGDILVWGFLASYVVLLPYTRRLLEKYEQRAESRIAPEAQD